MDSLARLQGAGLVRPETPKQLIDTPSRLFASVF